MSTDHTAVLSAALLEASRRGWRLSPNQVGMGFAGTVLREYDVSGSTGPRHVVEMVNPRRIRYGLFNPGGLDAIGWQTVEITPEMVGARVAVFTAIDAKTAGYPTLSERQRNFIRQVTQAGGLCYVARRKDGALVLEIVGEWV